MKKANGLTTQLWKYLGVFTVIIMLTLWVLQIIFLNTIYESMKIRQINRIGNEIVQNYNKNSEDFDELWYQHSFRRGLFAMIVSKEGEIIKSPNTFASFRPPENSNHSKDNFINSELGQSVMQRIENSPDNTCCYAIDWKQMHSKMVIYGAKIKKDGEYCYLYLTSPLEAVDATRQVLQKQLAIVSLLSIIIALVLAYFIARRVAKPIQNIAHSARELTHGNYKVKFDGGTYREINELADVLNNATDELSKTEALRRDLMANVTHDLKTPLTIIRSYAEMIRDLSGKNEQKRNEHANIIVDETERLSYLVNDILELSKMESGTVNIDYELFDMRDTVISIMNRFNVFAEKDGYIFNVNCDENMYVRADESKIEQVIYNLVGNAVNHCGDDKTIDVKLYKKQQNVHFEVTDYGCGIEPNEIELVWDRYYKISNNHNRGIVGTGIGLSIVKNILVMHNAKYGIQSEVGNGSTFWLELEYIPENFTNLS